MINYGKELKISIDLKTDLRKKQKEVAMNEFSEAAKEEAEVTSLRIFQLNHLTIIII